MKNGLVVCDAGPIFSLAIIGKLDLLNELFDSVHIPNAVWEEITRDKTESHFQRISDFFETKVKEISSINNLTFIMDYGESEAVLLYKELLADFLLIDDKKARKIAENFEVNCIGTLGLLATAKNKGLIDELRPLFKAFLDNKRFYSLKLLNVILKKHEEEEIG